MEEAKGAETEFMAGQINVSYWELIGMGKRACMGKEACMGVIVIVMWIGKLYGAIAGGLARRCTPSRISPIIDGFG